MSTLNRGGKREGAGRPKKINKKVLTAVRLPPDLLEWISQQNGSKASVIIKAIESFRQTNT